MQVATIQRGVKKVEQDAQSLQVHRDVDSLEGKAKNEVRYVPIWLCLR
jgi:hypothetical protein